MENKRAGHRGQMVAKLSIDESREKRLGRIKAKRRDRGGIFKPREDNPLLDILMSKDVSGRSPSKAKAKAKPRSSSVDRDPRNVSPPRSRRPPRSSSVSRRKSVAGNGSTTGAVKQRRKSAAPPSNEEHPNNERPANKTAKVSSISRTSSKRSENSENVDRRATAASKRRREDEEVESNAQTGDADLPSPPKRLKKVAASATPASASTSKLSAVPRKPSSGSKAKSKIKQPAPSRWGRVVEEETVPSKPDQPSGQKKRGRPKKDVTAAARDSKIDNCDADEDALTSISTSTSKRPPKSKTNNALPSTKRTTAALKRRATGSRDGEKSIASKTPDKTRSKGKAKRADPIPGPDSEPELEEEAYSRMKIPKPQLDTVIEEDEEEFDEAEAENNAPKATSSRRNASQSQTAYIPEPRGGDGRNRKGKRKAQDMDDPEALPRTSTENTKKVTGKTKAGSRARGSGSTVEKSKAVEKTSFEPPQKHKDPALPSKRTKPASKPKTTRQPKSKPKSKTPSTRTPSNKSKQPSSTSKIMQRPKIATLPTTLFSSPIKAADNEDDEIDFLS